MIHKHHHLITVKKRFIGHSCISLDTNCCFQATAFMTLSAGKPWFADSFNNCLEDIICEGEQLANGHHKEGDHLPVSQTLPLVSCWTGKTRLISPSSTFFDTYGGLGRRKRSVSLFTLGFVASSFQMSPS